MQIDYSKGRALHNLYGHYTFVMEASKVNKGDKFIDSICSAIGCKGLSNDWRGNIDLTKL